MNHILQAVSVVIPIIFVLCFGFFASRQKAFGTEGNPISNINELVLNFALPPALFVGTITVTRSALSADFILFIVLFTSLLVGYLVGFVIAKLLFKRSIIEASIAGLAVSFSAGPFYGPALLGSLYGIQSGVAVSIISLVINVFIVPLATIMIKLHIAKESKTHSSVGALVGHSIFDAIFKTPFVWAPLLAFILVFLGLHTPVVVNNSLDLIGKATAGVAVFVAGMTIAENKFKLSGEVLIIALLKNIGLPLLFIAVVMLFKMPSGTVLFNEGILLAALPSGPMIVLLATRYKAYQQQASSILAVSTIGMLITVTALIMILGL
ncbi:AEC family transporter [Orbus sturtevantii]|uniref:AEC family transporter n=1 Tax=Orbus sturtevantii TaxID=3074109 RepID=UPI00370D3854